MGTVVGRAAADPRVLQWSATARARVVTAAVLDQERSRESIELGPRIDRLFEDRVSRAIQIAQHVVVETIGVRSRVDMRGEQHLVGVDVAEARDHVLIHQRRLDRTAVTGEHVAKAGRVELERVGAEVLVGEKAIDVVDELDRPEHSNIDEREVIPVGEVEAHPRVRRRCRFALEVRERAGHPEVQAEPAVPCDACEQVLAVAAGLRELVPDQRRIECTGRHTAKHSTGRNLDAADALMQ